MTVRAWLELLIVPLALAVIGFLFTMQQDARQQAIENQRSKAERELAQERNQNEALQAYLDQMTNLLLERDLREAQEDSEVSTLAQARTLTVLGAINAVHKTEVIRFLINVDLLQRVDGKDPVIELDSADLAGVKLENPSPYVVNPGHGADLSGADLGLTDLRKVYLVSVNLVDANLRGANLDDANLSFANLSDANLREVYLRGADLRGANLSGAELGRPGANAILAEANLSGANLSNADLEDADLSGASLKGVILSEANRTGGRLGGANLKGAILDEANLSKAHGITKEQLEEQAGPLEGATMPDGSKHD